MNKKQVLQLIKAIESFYDNPFTKKRGVTNQDDSNEKVLMDTLNNWHEMLKDENAEIVFDNLKQHIKTNKFPPTIAELLKKEERQGRYIPRHADYDMTAGEDWN